MLVSKDKAKVPSSWILSEEIVNSKTLDEVPDEIEVDETENETKNGAANCVA